jgi:hypothetical protein
MNTWLSQTECCECHRVTNLVFQCRTESPDLNWKAQRASAEPQYGRDTNEMNKSDSHVSRSDLTRQINSAGGQS